MIELKVVWNDQEAVVVPQVGQEQRYIHKN